MENPEGFFINDHLTYPALAAAGWDVELVPWNRPGVNWKRFDAVVIRSTWDYQQAPQQFLESLEAIEQAGCRLLNPLSVVRWNLDKSYLRELEGRGVAIVPTKWISNLTDRLVQQVFVEFRHADRVVVKPTISANADDTLVLHRDDPAGWEIALEVFARRPLMAQPFVDSIIQHGEYSLFYFGGRYSHAILKTPATGDFRVQEEHGGTFVAVEPDATFAMAGRCAMDAIDSGLLYARVDLVRLNDQTAAVMEVELIEPSLYFESDPESAGRFARAFVDLATAQ